MELGWQIQTWIKVALGILAVAALGVFVGISSLSPERTVYVGEEFVFPVPQAHNLGLFFHLTCAPTEAENEREVAEAAVSYYRTRTTLLREEAGLPARDERGGLIDEVTPGSVRDAINAGEAERRTYIQILDEMTRFFSV